MSVRAYAMHRRLAIACASVALLGLAGAWFLFTDAKVGTRTRIMAKALVGSDDYRSTWIEENLQSDNVKAEVTANALSAAVLLRSRFFGHRSLRNGPSPSAPG